MNFLESPSKPGISFPASSSYTVKRLVSKKNDTNTTCFGIEIHLRYQQSIDRTIIRNSRTTLLAVLCATSATALPDFSHLIPADSSGEADQEDQAVQLGPFYDPSNEGPTGYDIIPTETSSPSQAGTLFSRLGEDFEIPFLNLTTTTRSTSYQYQWGGNSDSCQYKAPETIIKCLDGGLLILRELSNALCDPLADDIAKCSQGDGSVDAMVDFQCIGITEYHLTAEVRKLSSKAVKCSGFNGTHDGGGAVVGASLGRFCTDPATGSFELNDQFPCSEGEPEIVDGRNLCTSTKECIGTDCTLLIEPISITAYDDSQLCSISQGRPDFTNSTFHPSSLASYHLVKWTYSDAAFSCDWAIPDIELQCRNGGFLRMQDPKDFCYTQDGTNVTVCTIPNPTSEIGRITVDLEVWCFGSEAEQLILDVRTLPTDSSGFTCQPDGLILQGFEIARACGDKPGESNSTLISSPSFCASGQLYDDVCYSAFLCPSGSEDCTGIVLDTVVGDTSDLAVGNCIFVGPVEL